MTWDEILRLAERHTPGARNCLERFVGKNPGGNIELLARALLEEWHHDPSQVGELQVPRPLGPDFNCFQVPGVEEELATIRPSFIEFEVFVNERGDATGARVVCRDTQKPAEKYERCELESALRRKYRPAWTGRAFASKNLMFYTHFHY